MRRQIINALTENSSTTFHVRSGFTSFVPSDIVEKTKSGKSVHYVYISPLPLDVVKSRMLKEFWEKREGNRLAILCCLGHQRALEILAKQLMEDSDALIPTSGNVFSQSGDGVMEKQHFLNLIQTIAAKLMDRYPIDWTEIEPALTGRKVEMGAKLPTLSKQYQDIFSNGVFINPPRLIESYKDLEEEMQRSEFMKIQVQPQTNLFVSSIFPSFFKKKITFRTQQSLVVCLFFGQKEQH